MAKFKKRKFYADKDKSIIAAPITIAEAVIVKSDNGEGKEITVKDKLEELYNTKVGKVEGKGLSTNDYTNTDKSKLDGLANIKSIGNNLSLINGVLSATGQGQGQGQETIIDNQTIAKNAQGELYVKEFTYNNIIMTPSELVQANTITFLEDGE